MGHPRCGLLQADWQGRRGNRRMLRVVLEREGLAVAVAAGTLTVDVDQVHGSEQCYFILQLL